MDHGPSHSYFNTGEVAIRRAVWPGTDPQILFIHGITGSLETWFRVAPEIAGPHGITAVDLRGHGRSGHTTGHYMLDDYARDMVTLIERTCDGPVVVTGHSLGAMTAVTLAASRPDLVLALVLEDPPLFARRIMEHDDPARFVSFKQTAALTSGGLSVHEIAAYLRNSAPDAPEEMLLHRARNLFNMDGDVVAHILDQRIDWTGTIEGTLQKVQCPTLLLQGNFALGSWMREADGEHAAELMCDCQLVKWSDTGHSLHSEHHDRFVAQVSRFLQERVKGFAAQKI